MARRRPFISLALLVCLASCVTLHAAESAAPESPPQRSVEALLRDLQPLGIDVIYSSELVPPDLLAPPAAPGATPLQRVIAALAAHGLELHEISPSRYVVARASASAAPREPPPPPIEEISVYASRYAIEGNTVAEARDLRSSDIEIVPGSHDDSLHALRSLPGMASNASGRPYIRGSLANDVLVRYDGITLLDPFHFKNFQSLISAIDPAAVERIEVFSGGFPVRYGTRSGGVIDIGAPSHATGQEYRAGVSLISAGLSAMGAAEKLPLEWLFAVRRSTLDLIDKVEDEFGQPQFSDSLGRLRWRTEKGVWTLGWLLLDDQLVLGTEGDEETANARYRDQYVWIARDHEFNPGLRTRFTATVTSSSRQREGFLDEPGVAAGTVDETTEFNRVEINNLWTYEPRNDVTYTFGAEAAISSAENTYERVARYDPVIAAAFDRSPTNDLQSELDPSMFMYAVHAAVRKQWTALEAELGLRLDGQHYNFGGDHTQISPRVNLRYDLNDRLRAYASAGRFTQAQPVEEWRVEEPQLNADPAQVSIHAIVGLTFDSSIATRWGLELYTKRWTTAAPYYDNVLNPLALSPDLEPDRIRIDPHESEASGLELNMHHDFSEALSGSGTLSWSRVTDDLSNADADSDALRSWDQPLALTAGLAWQGSRLSLSALAGWHRGWPRTPFALIPPANTAPGQIELGARNSGRWGDFFTLDLRGSFTWPLAHGDFSAVLEVTNVSNRPNDCCAVLHSTEDGEFFRSEIGNWLPAIANLGFSYRWRNSH